MGEKFHLQMLLLLLQWNKIQKKFISGILVLILHFMK